jgi:NO-binding membrane sensor protein with MHYT domain
MSHVQGSDDLVFVVCSVVFALVGSFAALVSAVRIPQVVGAQRVRWTLAAGVSLGGGAIWSMHFIGMLGYHVGDRNIDYNLPVTAVSLLIAIAVSTIGLAIVGSNPRSPLRLVFAGVITGLGVAAMHYTGMAAMEVGSKVTYDRTLVAASVVIAVVAALAALWIAFHVRTIVHIVAASIVMAVAVCGMHYTAMAATEVATTTNLKVQAGTDPIALTFLVCVIAATVLIFVIFAAFSGLSGSQPALAGVPTQASHARARRGQAAGQPRDERQSSGSLFTR